MQILRTKGIKSHGWGGYLHCMVQPSCLPVLEFKYIPKASTKYLKYIVAYRLAIPSMYRNMPIGMSTDTCIRYWEDL